MPSTTWEENLGGSVILATPENKKPWISRAFLNSEGGIDTQTCDRKYAENMGLCAQDRGVVPTRIAGVLRVKARKSMIRGHRPSADWPGPRLTRTLARSWRTSTRTAGLGVRNGRARVISRLLPAYHRSYSRSGSWSADGTSARRG